jgi:hypothetical protein
MSNEQVCYYGRDKRRAAPFLTIVGVHHLVLAQPQTLPQTSSYRTRAYTRIPNKYTYSNNGTEEHLLLVTTHQRLMVRPSYSQTSLLLCTSGSRPSIRVLYRD